MKQNNMKKNSILITVIVFAGLIIGCGNNNSTSKETDSSDVATFDLPAMKKIIKEKSDKFTQAHITRDTAYLNNIFSKDANVYSPNSDIITGRDAIATVNTEWVNYGIKEFTEETTSFFGNESYLIDEGTFYLRYGEDNITDKGKYINIWKKENGEWKICSSIWNTSLPLTTTE
jgi:ketosteroid isomerase-like protein